MSPSEPPSICASDVAVDSHSAPSVLRIFLRKTRTDLFGKDVFIFVGRTSSPICPVAALLGYLSINPAQPGLLFIWPDGTPLSREHFVREVRSALMTAGIDCRAYSGHSFQIGAATMAAQAGLLAHLIKMLRRWTSDAHQLYIHTPREVLAAVSPAIAL